MKKLSIFIVSAFVMFSAVSSGYAIVGAGFHWGFDYSLSMEPVADEPVTLPELDATIQSALGKNSLVTVSRTNWRSSALNFGGKVYIDFIPFIEAIEVSCNFGLWQYDGSLNYADIGLDGNNNLTVKYKQVDLTTKSTGLDYWVLDGTPYAKLQLDATIRKEIVDFWIVKLSGGAGFSSHFTTPLLTAKLVEDVVGSKLSAANADLGKLLDPKGNISKDIVNKIIDEALGNPVYGMHLLLGIKAKLPVIPVGIYVDGKYMIPFTKFDENAGDKGIDGWGFLLNAGISLSI